MTRQARVVNMATPSAHPEGDGWYRISNQAAGAGQPLEVELYDQIGFWGIRAADLLRELKAADDGLRPIEVGINSIGGDVFDGLAIHNAFRRYGERVTVRIDGVAASIASVIAVGAHRVVMPANAMMMIHNPGIEYASGEADDLRTLADMMDKAKASLIAAYRAKAPSLAEDELSRMMDATTWLTAQEALALGLVDEVTDSVKLTASAGQRASIGRMRNAPAALLAALQGETPPAPVVPADPAAGGVELVNLLARLCLEAKLPTEAVAAVASASRMANEAEIRRGVEQAVAVRNLCLTAKLPELANSLIASGVSEDAARARLFDKLVINAGEELDNVVPEASPSPVAVNRGPSASQIYAKRQGANNKVSR
ncbi:Clp protease ClpP [Chromobacterium subtsugae]|uniref:ATP-dependent Clp protease proteolytic subunit n=1 Tax=Chromobacterium subtsugae TaxID=251747 RepID=A0ABS7FDI5_9NEIS|nr:MULTISPECIES: head maturation protease, ClpP-related [Chromobacterium]MBW7566290.1 Clp protease ClpP [Chromobacterium subtsugae]MBW8287851.1 Clp protease ClpP [Chromobacterium subtsugae]WSE91180.1 head maturation protease, ClpP-related [Chromobacterium subtsugae]WVH59555.1 head maturation protease, ClpP-related [Chromobacterium subtsugae]